MSIAVGPFDVVISTSTVNSQTFASRTVTECVPADKFGNEVVAPKPPPSTEY